MFIFAGIELASGEDSSGLHSASGRDSSRIDPTSEEDESGVERTSGEDESKEYESGIKSGSEAGMFRLLLTNLI